MGLYEQIVKADPTFWEKCRTIPMCDIDSDFMGFTDVYKHLAQIIPKDRVVIDLGCAYATQATYFQKHKAYVGVDLDTHDIPRVQTKNSQYYLMTIKEFIQTELPRFKDEKLFAICSYVPPWHDDNEKLVRENFKHLFVYYPI